MNFSFWRGRELSDPDRLLEVVGKIRMGSLRLEKLSDLAAALQRSKQARTTFDAFSYSNRKDYVEWITDAKRDETRARRIRSAIEWMAEGKPRNWKYMREWR